MSLSTPMSKDDMQKVTLLALGEVIFRQLLLNSTPHTRQYNQLKGVLTKIGNIDKTFVGHLPDDYADVCSALLNGVQEQLDKALEAV